MPNAASIVPGLLAVLMLAGAAAAQGRDLVLKPVTTLSLGDVEGQLDQLAIDEAGGRLFVTAIAHGSVQVFDLKTEKRVGEISGLKSPQGIAYVPELKRLVVTTPEDGKCHFFDEQLKPIGVIDLKEADTVRYDPASKLLYVSFYTSLATVDPVKMVKTAEVALGGHGEGLVIERTGNRLFVNVPMERRIAVIDRRTLKVVQTWPTGDPEFNFPMGLDESRQRLFVGCRRPKMMLAFDTDTGKVVEQLECCGDADAIHVDPTRRRVYLTGGGGCVNVFEFTGERYELIETVTTNYGARTSLYVPSLNRLFVAIPHRDRWQKPMIRVFEPQ